MSLFEELKRRNVFRVGIAYLVSAWLVVQVSDVLFDAFALPDWSMRLVVILLAVALPVVLFAAWAYELTPQGIKRETEVDRDQSVTPQTGKRLNLAIMLLLLLAVAYLLFDKLSRDETPPAVPATASTASSGDADAVPTTATIDPNSIAVLPFDNRSQLEEDAYFVQGIHDDLLTNLARIGGLKVISRTSVLRYGDTDKSIPEIAAELGVATVMEGAVQRSADTVRVNVQLIDAATDQHVWAEIYDRQLSADNLFTIQSEISGRIAGALKATLSPSEQRRIDNRPTEDLAAYNAYLRGRQALARDDAEGADTALAEFRRAVELDPDFAGAWAGIARAAHQAFYKSDLDLAEAKVIAGEAAGRAKELNPELGEAWLAEAMVQNIGRGDGQARIAALRKAIELSPGDANAYLELAEALPDTPAGAGEALELIEQAARLDPLSKQVQIALAYALLESSQFDEAERHVLRLIEEDPDFAPFHRALSMVFLAQGHLDKSLLARRRAQELDPGNIRLVLQEMMLLTSLGMEEEMDRLIERIDQMDPDSSTLLFVTGMIQAYRGQREASVTSAERYGEKFATEPMTGVVSMARSNVLNGFADAARPLWERVMPGLFDPDRWDGPIHSWGAQSCWWPWILVETGEADLGRTMATRIQEILREERPLGPHPFDLMLLAVCNVISGDESEALDHLEQALDRGALMAWWTVLRHPALDPLRDEPRFQDVVDAIEDRMAEQRANLERTWAEESP